MLNEMSPPACTSKRVRGVIKNLFLKLVDGKHVPRWDMTAFTVVCVSQLQKARPGRRAPVRVRGGS